MEAAVAAFEAVGLGTGVARNVVVYALVSAGHVLAIALLIGPIIAVDLKLLGGLTSLPMSALPALRHIAQLGLVLAMLTGLLLFSARPGDYADNWAVGAKLAVLTLAVANAALAEVLIRKHSLAALSRQPVAKGLAAGSLALWATVLFLGRWIAFV